ncbi:hypothetical protein ACQ4LE_010232 [Meloidogyne hapla]
MPSSPILLSLSTIFALIGFSLVILATFSDQWLEYQVDRKFLIERKAELDKKYERHFISDPLFYSRNQGLAHLCFPDLVPNSIGSYSKFGSVCITSPDLWPDSAQTQKYNGAQMQRLWMQRGMICLFIVGLCVCVLALGVGIVGCYRRSPKLVGWTAMMFLLSVLFMIFGMLLWHYVNYMERKVLDMYPFYQDWPRSLKQATRITFGWSYIVCWVGIGCSAVTAFLLWLSRRAIRDEEESLYEQKHAHYLQQQYYGGGAPSDKSLVPLTAATLPPHYGYGTYGYGGYPAYYGQYAASPYGLYGGYYAPV